MPGSIYMRNLRLARAYAEGSKGAPATNPHPANTPANLAYTEGAKKVCATYAGVAECPVAVGGLSSGTGTGTGAKSGYPVQLALAYGSTPRTIVVTVTGLPSEKLVINLYNLTESNKPDSTPPSPIPCPAGTDPRTVTIVLGATVTGDINVIASKDDATSQQVSDSTLPPIAIPQPASDFSAHFGTYVVGASASVADGEVFVDSGKAYVNVLDNGGTDQATALMAFAVGDTLRVKAASDNNWWDIVLTAAPSKTGSVVTFTGTVTVHGTAPTTATATELRKKPAALNPAAPPVDDTPDETWIKADIQQWLTDHSIDYPSSATKAELIALVP